MNPEKCIRLNTNQLMPTVGLGTYAATGEEMKKTLRSALECGYRSIDTAYLYLNEDAIGEVLNEWFSEGKIKREDIFVTSKLPAIGNRKEDVKNFLERTLKALQLDYLDLYLVHHPFGMKGHDYDDTLPKDAEGNSILDMDTNIEEVWKAMEEQVDAGLTKAIGISNFNSEQTHRIMKIARIAPAVNQVEAHVYLQQRPLKALCDSYGIVMCAYGPLGAPYRGGGTEEFPLLIEHPKVLQIASQYNKTPGQILLKFLLQKGFVIIPKSATPERIQSNIELFDFTLTKEDMETLVKLDRAEHGRVLDFITFFIGVEKHKEWPFRIPY